MNVVTLDLITHQMDGKECLQELHALDPSTKVIVASGFAPDDQARDMIESKALAFVG